MTINASTIGGLVDYLRQVGGHEVAEAIRTAKDGEGAYKFLPEDPIIDDHRRRPPKFRPVPEKVATESERVMLIYMLDEQMFSQVIEVPKTGPHATLGMAFDLALNLDLIPEGIDRVIAVREDDTQIFERGWLSTVQEAVAET